MQIEHLENHTARLTVDVPEERFAAAMQRAAKRLAAKVNIPGFRKGKAPFAVVVNYVGQQAVMDEALEDLGNEIYRESLQAANLQPYTTGSLEDVKTEPSLQLIFSVPKAPEVDLATTAKSAMSTRRPSSPMNRCKRRLRRCASATPKRPSSSAPPSWATC